MNDLMSMGIHRYWKAELVKTLGNLAPDKLYTYQKTRPTIRVLDVAGGTGDISLRILENHGYRSTDSIIET